MAIGRVAARPSSFLALVAAKPPAGRSAFESFCQAYSCASGDPSGIGANNEYKSKPFDVGELRARLRALLRRAAPVEDADGRLAFAELRLDPARHGAVVTAVGHGAEATKANDEGAESRGNGEAEGAESRGNREGQCFVELTRTEYQLLELLLRNPRRVLSHSVIYERVWGYDFGPSSNAMRVYIGYLRRKLEQAGARPLIHNVRGVGYVLREP